MFAHLRPEVLNPGGQAAPGAGAAPRPAPGAPAPILEKYDTQTLPGKNFPFNLNSIGINHTINNFNDITQIHNTEIEHVRIHVNHFGGGGSIMDNSNVRVKYNILNEISRGAYGVVYRISDPLDNTIYCCKVQNYGSGTAGIKILKEAIVQHIIYETSKNNDHYDCIYTPKVYKVYMDIVGKKIIIIQEYLQNARTLNDIIESNLASRLANYNPYFIRITRKLQNLWRLYNFNHGDFHAGNILIVNDNPKLIDFGRSSVTINRETLYVEPLRDIGNTLSVQGRDMTHLFSYLKALFNARNDSDIINTSYPSAVEAALRRKGMRAIWWACSPYFNEGNDNRAAWPQTILDTFNTRVPIGDNQAFCGARGAPGPAAPGFGFRAAPPPAAAPPPPAAAPPPPAAAPPPPAAAPPPPAAAPPPPAGFGAAPGAGRYGPGGWAGRDWRAGPGPAAAPPPAPAAAPSPAPAAAPPPAPAAAPPPVPGPGAYRRRGRAGSPAPAAGPAPAAAAEENWTSFANGWLLGELIAKPAIRIGREAIGGLKEIVWQQDPVTGAGKLNVRGILGAAVVGFGAYVAGRMAQPQEAGTRKRRKYRKQKTVRMRGGRSTTVLKYKNNTNSISKMVTRNMKKLNTYRPSLSSSTELSTTTMNNSIMTVSAEDIMMGSVEYIMDYIRFNVFPEIDSDTMKAILINLSTIPLRDSAFAPELADIINTKSFENLQNFINKYSTPDLMEQLASQNWPMNNKNIETAINIYMTEQNPKVAIKLLRAYIYAEFPDKENHDAFVEWIMSLDEIGREYGIHDYYPQAFQI